ncbi:MAG: membrane dipeptidase [Gemmatimonadetes bacterium]|nr:membrane dipeptidase [Gemmatimonadota bacterium]
MPSYLERARGVLTRAPLIDGHNDLVWVVRERGGDPAAYDLRVPTPGCTDLARLERGMVGGQFWAVYVPCAQVVGAARAFAEEIELAEQIIAAYPDRFERTFTADEVEAAIARGRIACLIGLEGGQAIEGSLDALRRFRALGVRYITLTHNCTHDWADSALDVARHGGLSPFGVEVVREMNRLGILVDLSHTSPACMHRALDVSEAPVIWSHAAARALVDHPRNVPDDALARLRSNGGVAMATFVTGFVSARQAAWDRSQADPSTARAEEENPMPVATLADVADHIDHMRDVAGVDHVGIGSDFDGFARQTRGLEDVGCFPALFAELARRGWTDDDLEQLSGGNVLRVLREAERVAGVLRR